MTEERVDASVEPAVEDSETAQPTSIRDLKRKMRLKGRVERLELYGAFIDLGLETSALVHISKMGKGHVNRVSDVVNVGDEVEVWVDKVDPAQNQVMVTMVEPLAVDWSDLEEGQVYTGKVKRLENFGAFVDIGAEREGLVHISELSHDYVKQPSEVVNVGDEVEVQILGFSRRKRRIDLSMKALQDKPVEQGGFTTATRADIDDFEEEEDEMPTAMAIAWRQATGKDDRRRKGNKKSRRRRRDDQEEIYSRTLRDAGDR
ncbi:MAG: S1 RNA-binding domain-containing protein [Anaerolineae bacterium]|nr:S1 RNA-binding domain-containing protein [Anaerolineae bacterium]